MSRRTRWAAVTSVLITLASSFGVASYAFGSRPSPRIRSDLPVAGLPTISLDEATSVQINNLIGEPGVERFGITAASYDQVRVLSRTSDGDFYLIPGTNGACVVGPASTACGDPGAGDETMIALVQETADGTGVIGAGIAVAKATKVALRPSGASPPISLHFVHGVFVLDRRAGLKPSQVAKIQFSETD